MRSVIVPLAVGFEEIEALLGHEMVHKEQHKKTGEYFKQSERIVNQINDMRLKLNKLLKMPVLHLSTNLELDLFRLQVWAEWT